MKSTVTAEFDSRCYHCDGMIQAGQPIKLMDGMWIHGGHFPWRGLAILAALAIGLVLLMAVCLAAPTTKSGGSGVPTPHPGPAVVSPGTRSAE